MQTFYVAYYLIDSSPRGHVRQALHTILHGASYEDVIQDIREFHAGEEVLVVEALKIEYTADYPWQVSEVLLDKGRGERRHIINAQTESPHC